MLDILLLFIGFIVLAKCSDWFIENATIVGQRFGLSQVFLGLTVVAIGTSAPELSVNLLATAKNLHELPIGNILGSNLTNILLVLGIAALIHPVKVLKNTVKIGLPISLLSILLVATLAQDKLLLNSSTFEFSRLDGIVLLACLPLYAYFAYKTIKPEHPNKQPISNRRLWLSILGIVISIFGLVISADWIVRGALTIVSYIGLREHLVGFTIVALGTSLPELATTITAMLKRKNELVVGTVVGSNLINIFLVLGLSALLNPFQIGPKQFYDIVAVAAATGVVILYLTFKKDYVIRRQWGWTFIMLYLIYQCWRITIG
ncbi:calcium/sodium antiporter [Patescibacteria group bacterium]|nr:calcium/sodium antiporter [Patescibacteria group bacterium]